MLQTFPCGLESLPTAIYARGPLWKTIKAPANSSNHLVFAAAEILAGVFKVWFALLLLQKPLFNFSFFNIGWVQLGAGAWRIAYHRRIFRSFGHLD